MLQLSNIVYFYGAYSSSMPENYYLFIFLAFVSEVLGTVSGFGSSILFVPIASMFFDFTTVLGITAVFHVFSNLSKIAFFHKGIHLNIVLKLGIPAVVFVVIGAFLTARLPAAELEFGMNIVLIVLAMYLITHISSKVKQTDVNLYSAGIASGFLAGIVGTGGAIRGIVLAGFGIAKDAFVATSAVIDLGVDASRTVVYLWNGYFKWQYIVLIPFLILISVSGTYVGKLILRQTPEEKFRYVVLGIIVVTALIEMGKFLFR